MKKATLGLFFTALLILVVAPTAAYSQEEVPIDNVTVVTNSSGWGPKISYSKIIGNSGPLNNYLFDSPSNSQFGGADVMVSLVRGRKDGRGGHFELSLGRMSLAGSSVSYRSDSQVSFDGVSAPINNEVAFSYGSGAYALTTTAAKYFSFGTAGNVQFGLSVRGGAGFPMGGNAEEYVNIGYVDWEGGSLRVIPEITRRTIPAKDAFNETSNLSFIPIFNVGPTVSVFSETTGTGFDIEAGYGLQGPVLSAGFRKVF